VQALLQGTHRSQRRTHVSQRRTHVSQRRTHVSQRRTHVSLRRTHVSLQRTHVSQQRTPLFLQRSPAFVHRSPAFLQRSPEFLQRAPLFLQRAERVGQMCRLPREELIAAVSRGRAFTGGGSVPTSTIHLKATDVLVTRRLNEAILRPVVGWGCPWLVVTRWHVSFSSGCS